MNKTLSNQKRKLTTIKNQVLKARDFDLEKAQLFTTKAIQATVDTVKSMKHGVAFELVLPELTQL